MDCFRAVEADGEKIQPGQLVDPVRDPGSATQKIDRQAERFGMTNDGSDVGSEHRLAAAEADALDTGFGKLVEQTQHRAAAASRFRNNGSAGYSDG
jgi:hypothetical protein